MPIVTWGTNSPTPVCIGLNLKYSTINKVNITPNIEPIIPDLIDIGVTILNPVQPECMDPVKLKNQYGDKLAFDGTIGIQTTMPFGTSEDVDNEVKRMIETVGKGGGLIIAPTHVLEPEVPIENIAAFMNAVDRYGHYV